MNTKEDKTMFSLSYNEACTKDLLDLRSDIILADEAGFDFIELRFDCIESFLKEGGTPEEIREIFRTRRIRPHALNALYIYPEYRSRDDIEEKAALLDDKLALIDKLHAAVGIDKCIVVAPLMENSITASEYEREYVVWECARILDELSYLMPYMTWIFEPVGLRRSLVRDVRTAKEILTLTNSKKAGLVLDACNLFLTNLKSDYDFSMLRADEIRAVHLMNGVNPGTDEITDQSFRRMCSDANFVDTQAFLRELLKTGYNGMVSCEVFYPEYEKRYTHSQIINMAYASLVNELKKYKDRYGNC